MATPDESQEIEARLRHLEAEKSLLRRTMAEILAFSTRLTRNTDLASLYRECTALAKGILNLDFSTLMIMSDDGKALVIRDAIGFPASMINTFTLLEGQGLSTYVVTKKKPAVVEDFQTEKRFTVPPVVFQQGIVSALSVPMMLGGAVFGVMIGHTRDKRFFTADEIGLYQSIANQAAVAIKNVMHFDSLQDSEKRFRTLIDRAGDAVYLADMNGRLADVNSMACQALGYSRDELLKLTVFDVDPPAVEARPQERLWPHLSADQYVTVNSQHRRKDGSLFPVEIRIGLMPLHGTNYVLGFARDISERQQAENDRQRLQEQLVQAQKMESIGTLAGGIAHDFNNILAAIIGYAELARENIKDEGEALKDLAQVLKAGNRAKDLVRQILTFSRKGELPRQPLQPAAIVKEVLKLIRASLPSTIEIREEIAPDCGTILADPTNIHQVLMNLCTNAHHAMEDEKGLLTVKLTRVELPAAEAGGKSGAREGAFVELVVRDTGHGMDEATLARIFEPYFTTKKFGKGSGMGLALVHGIVQGCGGFMEVESEPGRGTTFHAYFPLVEGKMAESTAAEQKPLPTGNERILAIDDEEVIVEMYKATLEQLGYTVRALSNSEEAMALFRAAPDGFDLIITDQTMPNIPGSELAEMIWRIRPGIPIILCTGYSSMVSENQARELGVDRFLMKPVSRQQLAETVRSVLDQRKAKAG